MSNFIAQMQTNKQMNQNKNYGSFRETLEGQNVLPPPLTSVAGMWWNAGGGAGRGEQETRFEGSKKQEVRGRDRGRNARWRGGGA